MKKEIILWAFLGASSLPVAAQTSYLEQIQVENRQVEKTESRSVRVSMDLLLDSLDMNRQHSLLLEPVILSADGSREQALTPIYINGKVRDKVVERSMWLNEGRSEGDTVRIRRRNGRAQSYYYETDVPFRRWMLNGRLDVRGYVTGCAACSEGDENAATGQILPYEAPQYALSVAQQPQEEVIKHRSETRAARLQYRQNGHDVRPDFKNNRAELDEVQASIDAVDEDINLTITGIYVTGYASPEASVPYNLALSERRAKTFVAYVKRRNPDLPDTLWHVAWKGEDWAGLRQAVADDTGVPRQAEVLRIIDACEGNQDRCERQLKDLRPSSIYQYLLNELYGPLRRNEYRIEYNVRNFTVEEAAQIIHNRPEQLSAAEMQRVADSYGRNSEAYRSTLKIALDTYPDNRVIRHNAALAEIEAGQYEAAVALLKDDAAADGEMLNLLGVAYVRLGQNDKARDAFRRAVDAGGSGDAADNLAQLEADEKMLAE